MCVSMHAFVHVSVCIICEHDNSCRTHPFGTRFIQSMHMVGDFGELKLHSVIDLYITYISRLKLPSLFAERLFWTFHNKLHNMTALVILSHHDHYFSHLLFLMKKNELLWVPVSSSGVFSWEKKLPTAHRFNIGAHIRICAQISRNILLYLPSLKRESPILLLMLISH